MVPRETKWDAAVTFRVSWETVAGANMVTNTAGFLGALALPAQQLAAAVGQLIWTGIPPGSCSGVYASWPRYTRDIARVVPPDVFKQIRTRSTECSVLPIRSEEALVSILEAAGMIAGAVFAVVSNRGSNWAREYFREPELYLDPPEGWYPVAGMGYQHDILAVVGHHSVEEVRDAFRQNDLEVSVVQATSPL
jgi:hypothetical protein